MVNPSSLATVGAAAAAALGIGGDAAATATEVVQRIGIAAAKKAAKARSAPSIVARESPLLLDPATIRRLSTALGTILRGGGTRAGVPGWAPAPAPASRTTSSSTSRSALSFLSDPKLSVEDKLMRLMAYLSERWEKEMQSKMDQIAAGEGDTSGTGATTKTTKKKSGGILGKIASTVSSVVGGDVLKAVSGFLSIPGVKSALGKIAGPVLAAGASALGFPMAAPLLLKYGSKVVDLVGGVTAAAGSSSSSSTSSTSGTMTDGKRQQLVMEVQRIYEKQKEMFSMVSNILRTGHDTRMTAINNIR